MFRLSRNLSVNGKNYIRVCRLFSDNKVLEMQSEYQNSKQSKTTYADPQNAPMQEMEALRMPIEDNKIETTKEPKIQYDSNMTVEEKLQWAKHKMSNLEGTKDNLALKIKENAHNIIGLFFSLTAIAFGIDLFLSV